MHYNAVQCALSGRYIQILGKISVFCAWSKKYSYEAIIDLATRKVEAYWKNGNLK